MIPLLKPDNRYYINGDFGVISPRDKTDTPLHTHDFAEFVYVFRGSCVHTVDGRAVCGRIFASICRKSGVKTRR